MASFQSVTPEVHVSRQSADIPRLVYSSKLNHRVWRLGYGSSILLVLARAVMRLWTWIA